MKNHISKLNLFIFLFFIFCFLFSGVVLAQTAVNQPQFMVSWQADSYVPSWYQGKILPTQGSKIKVGFELIDGGKIITLSENRVRWYINDKLVKNESSGLGIKSYSSIVSDYAGKDTEIKIAILPCAGRCGGYKGGEILYKIIKIPVVSPEAVIDAPYKERRIFAGKNIFLAYPFFFSVKNLDEISLSWFVNGQEAKVDDKEPGVLNLKIDSAAVSGDAISLRLIIKNLLKDLEFRNVEKQLIIK